jgi:hypothetical protein
VVVVVVMMMMMMMMMIIIIIKSGNTIDEKAKCMHLQGYNTQYITMSNMKVMTIIKPIY